MRRLVQMRDLDVKPSSALRHSAPEKAPVRRVYWKCCCEREAIEDRLCP